MRIIAGRAGGRKLKSRKSTTTRPTQDRVREAIFNMLGAAIINAVGLDLFAGFGGLGLEAISRGAEEMTFVENRGENCRIIEQNIGLCRFQESTRVIRSDVFKYLETADCRYDIIFMDPPYGRGLINKSLDLIISGEILNNRTLIVAEHHRDDLIEEFADLDVIRDREYGDTCIKIFAVKEE